jgi:hypothetical protein
MIIPPPVSITRYHELTAPRLTGPPLDEDAWLEHCRKAVRLAEPHILQWHYATQTRKAKADPADRKAALMAQAALCEAARRGQVLTFP